MLRAHRSHVRAAFGVLACIVVLSACGSDGRKTAGPTPGSNAGSNTATSPGTAGNSAGGSGSAAGDAAWFSEPPELDVPAESEDSELGPDEAGPVEGPEAQILPRSSPEPSDPLPTTGTPAGTDPCSFVPVREWRTWTNASASRATTAGDACLYTDPKDRNRMSVAVHTGPPPLDAATLAAAERIDGLDASVHWLEGTPTAFGSTMVAETKGRTVMITLFTRDPEHDGAAAKQAAQSWVALAITGLP